MKKLAVMNFGITLAGVLALLVVPARADTFGSGADTFTVDFVDIGNPGNFLVSSVTSSLVVSVA